MAKLDAEIPWCTIILVAGTLVAHTLVLIGNLEVSQMFNVMGASTAGWSNIGTSLSDAMANELDVLMSNATDVLTDSLDKVQEVQETVDFVFGLAGSITEDVLSHYGTVSSVSVLSAMNASLLQSSSFSGKLVGGSQATRVKPMYTPRVVAARQKQLGIRENRRLARMYQEPAMLQLQKTGNLTDLEANTQAILDAVWNNITDGTGIAPPLDELEDKLAVAVKGAVDTIMSDLLDVMYEFVDIIKPALEQIGVWVVGFSDSMQSALEGFSSTIDKIQKIFDQVMASLSSSTGTNEEDVIFDSYALFDTSNVGYITVSDITTVADLYGLTVLTGDTAAELFEKYDEGQDGKMTIDEFAMMATDPSIADIMPVMIRTYSKLLAQIGGNVGAAVMRDEVASAVVDYFTLVCAKNLTKVGWVSEMLINQTLPLAFTHDVLVELADNKDNPNALTDQDVGAIVVNSMAWLGAVAMADAIVLMTDPLNWQTEGYLASDQAPTIKQIVVWVLQCNNTDEVVARLPAPFNEVAYEDLADAIANFTQMRSDSFQAEVAANTTDINDAYYSTGSSTALADALLGGVAASAANSDDTQLAAVNSGVAAVPATLLFAQWLSWNATDQAAIYESECFNYTSTSSSTLDNFVDQIQTMVNKMVSFLTTMEDYAGDAGIEQLESFVADFAEGAVDDIVNILMAYVDGELQELNATLSSPQAARMALIQQRGKIQQRGRIQQKVKRQDPTVVIDNAGSEVSGVISQIITLLTGLQLALPTVVDDLKFARTEVSAVAETLDTVFSNFQVSGPPIFDEIASLYSMLWTSYFVFFAILTTSVLFYGFWASGWFGGPKPSSEEDYEPPQTCMERMRCCCSSCLSCMRSCHDSNLCFWSFVILLEIIVFVLFIVSIVLCLLAGIKAFISMGCTTVYVLSDSTICQGVLSLIQGWLTTFFAGMGDLTLACDAESLLTCGLIASKTAQATMYMILGSLIAAVLSFQMIIETAILHERARWRKIFDDEAKIS